MSSELTIALQEANREIGALVTKLSENPVHTQNPVLRPGEIRSLHSQLTRVGKQLNLFSCGLAEDDASEAAIREYVGNLEALRGLLGKMQQVLTSRRERIRKELAHMHAAGAWMQTYRNVSF